MRFSCDVRGGRDISRPYKNLRIVMRVSRDVREGRDVSRPYKNLPNHCTNEAISVG